MERRPGKVPLPGHRRLSPVPVPNHSLRKSGKPGVYYEERQGVRHYKVSFKDSTGKRRFKWLGPVKLGEAVKAREDLNVSIRRREVVVSSENKTWKQVREEHVEARTVGTRTAEGQDSIYRNHCERLERLLFGQVTKQDILSLLSQAKSVKTGNPLDAGTKAQILHAVSSVFEHGVEMGYRATNPCRELSKRQRPRQGEGRRRILSADEETRLLAYCGRWPWLRPIIVVALYETLRLGEVAGLQVESVDFANDKLRVHQQLNRQKQLVHTKGADPRKGKRDRRDTNPIDLLPPAREALLELRMDAASGFFFHEDGEPRHTRAITRAFEEVVKLAGLPETEDGPVTFHSLRHTGISRLANDRRIPLVYVRDFAGHVSLSTTETYVHKIESEAVTAAAAEAMALEHAWNTDSGNAGNDGE
jgi:integrase